MTAPRHRDWTITRRTWICLAIAGVLAWSGILTAAWVIGVTAIGGLR